MNLFRICAYSAGVTPAYRHRLLAMGLRPGARFEILRTAPLGDPLHIRCGYSNLALRRQDLALLQLEAVEQES
ncbi:MAG TPA: FeoA domain-containing protein [Pseudomonas sp.]|nr:FeoA domain-containing protein [Pseudomonas sp.]